LAIRVNQAKENISDFSVKAHLDKPTLAYQLFVKADALRLANFFKEAVGRYLNSILLDRGNADSYYGLGICYKNLNRIDKAIEALEKAKKIREMDFSIYYELGVCHLLNGDVCSATKNLIKSLKLNPKNINAQIQLAITHEIMEENDMALMIYQKIIET
jgi:tetratricopeptide (TPR) repeat protein